MLTDPYGINDLTRTIIRCAIAVHREFGPGLLESAYNECLFIELRHARLSVARQVAIPLQYHGIALNTVYYLDLLVAESVIVAEGTGASRNANSG